MVLLDCANMFQVLLKCLHVCDNISFCVDETGYDGCAEPTYASESAAAIITMVFQHTENGG